jgi:hypothetical protein
MNMAEDLPQPTKIPYWFDLICKKYRNEWLILSVPQRLVLEFNARELAKEQSVFGLGEK